MPYLGFYKITRMKKMNFELRIAKSFIVFRIH